MTEARETFVIPWSSIKKYSEELGHTPLESEYFKKAMQAMNKKSVDLRKGEQELTPDVMKGMADGHS